MTDYRLYGNLHDFINSLRPKYQNYSFDSLSKIIGDRFKIKLENKLKLDRDDKLLGSFFKDHEDSVDIYSDYANCSNSEGDIVHFFFEKDYGKIKCVLQTKIYIDEYNNIDEYKNRIYELVFKKEDNIFTIIDIDVDDIVKDKKTIFGVFLEKIFLHSKNINTIFEELKKSVEPIMEGYINFHNESRMFSIFSNKPEFLKNGDKYLKCFVFYIFLNKRGGIYFRISFFKLPSERNDSYDGDIIHLYNDVIIGDIINYKGDNLEGLLDIKKKMVNDIISLRLKKETTDESLRKKTSKLKCLSCKGLII